MVIVMSAAASAARRLESAAHAIKVDADTILRCIECGAWDGARCIAANLPHLTNHLERALSDLANALKQEEQARD